MTLKVAGISDPNLKNNMKSQIGPGTYQARLVQLNNQSGKKVVARLRFPIWANLANLAQTGPDCFRSGRLSLEDFALNRSF